MQQAAVALQVGTQVNLPVNDLVEVIDGLFIMSTAKIQGSEFVIENKYTVAIEIDLVFLQVLFNIRYQFQPLGKRALHKVHVDLAHMEVHKNLNAVIVVIDHQVAVGKGLEFFQGLFQLGMVVQIEVGAH